MYRIVPSPQRFPLCCPITVTLTAIPAIPYPLANTNLPYRYNFVLLQLSYKWNHILCNLLISKGFFPTTRQTCKSVIIPESFRKPNLEINISKSQINARTTYHSTPTLMGWVILSFALLASKIQSLLYEKYNILEVHKPL